MQVEILQIVQARRYGLAVDELTAEHGLVTSGMVPALSALSRD
jgi:hypothetical protein